MEERHFSTVWCLLAQLSLTAKNPTWLKTDHEGPCCPRGGLDSQTEQITDSTSRWIFFFHNVRVVMLREVDAEGQRLMGSCGKEMDGWVKWPGAARTEKGWAARRRENAWVCGATRAAGWSSPSDRCNIHFFVFICRAPTGEMPSYITSLLFSSQNTSEITLAPQILD